MKALFLTVIVILALAGAGSVWVWQNGEDTAWQKTLEQVSGMWKKNDKQQPLEPTNPTAGPFPFAERVIDPETGWILFNQPEYVPISFLYPPEFEQRGATRSDWGGVILELENNTDNYELRVSIAADGQGLPPAHVYGKTTFRLGEESFVIDLLEENDSPPNLFIGQEQALSGTVDASAKILNFSAGSDVLRFQMWCTSSCSREYGRSTLMHVASSIRLASDLR